MPLGFSIGLIVALGGALLLAAGSELQSRAVVESRGQWRIFLLAPRWHLGLLLLATAVATNFIALALAPVSVVQSVSIAALAASAAFAGFTGRARIGGSGVCALALCIVGLLGFILLMQSSITPDPQHDPRASLAAVTLILSAATASGAVAIGVGARPRTPSIALFALGAGAIVFGAITTVFKCLVTLVIERGLNATLEIPLVWLALGVVAIGGLIANVLLQRAHRVFPPPVVVAAITIVDPLTAAVIGIAVLGEVALTPALTAGLIAFGSVAGAGVSGVSRIQRTPREYGPAVPSVSSPSAQS